MKKKVLLTPEQFDAIHICSLAYGGIGGGRLYRGSKPLCALGMLMVMAEAQSFVPYPFDGTANDVAVVRVNRRRGKPRSYDRIPFAAWVREMNVDINEAP